MLFFRCPCDQVLTIVEDAAGTVGECPACGRVIRAPRQAPDVRGKLRVLPASPASPSAAAAAPNAPAAAESEAPSGPADVPIQAPPPVEQLDLGLAPGAPAAEPEAAIAAPTAGVAAEAPTAEPVLNAPTEVAPSSTVPAPAGPAAGSAAGAPAGGGHPARSGRTRIDAASRSGARLRSTTRRAVEREAEKRGFGNLDVKRSVLVLGAVLLAILVLLVLDTLGPNLLGLRGASVGPRRDRAVSPAPSGEEKSRSWTGGGTVGPRKTDAKAK